MTSSIRILIVLALAALLGGCGQQQQAPQPRQQGEGGGGRAGGPPSGESIQAMVKRNREDFYTRLGMTKDQIAKYEKLDQKFLDLQQKGHDEIVAKHGEPQASKAARTAMSELTAKLQAEKEKEILALLKKEQHKKYFDHKAGKRM